MSEEEQTAVSLQEAAESSKGDSDVNSAAGHSQGTFTRLCNVFLSKVSDTSELIRSLAENRQEILQVTSFVVRAAVLESFNSGPIEGAKAGFSLILGAMADDFWTATIASHRALGSPDRISEDQALMIFRPPRAAESIQRLSAPNTFVTLYSILDENGAPMPALGAAVADACLHYCTPVSIREGFPTLFATRSVPHDASNSEILEGVDLGERDTSDSQWFSRSYQSLGRPSQTVTIIFRRH